MGNFRKLEVWQEARALTKLAYEMTKSFPSCERYGLTAQIRGAAVSIMANIAEGCGRNGRAELARFLSIAAGSATELECHFVVAEDQGYLNECGLQLQQRVMRIQRMLAGLIRRLRNQ